MFFIILNIIFRLLQAAAILGFFWFFISREPVSVRELINKWNELMEVEK